MSEDAALIEQPEGSPGAVSDAGSSLARVAGGFERGGGVVARASASVSAWQGPASVSFDGRVASYGLVMVAVEQVLQSARGAVRRYETALEDARTKIRELREQEEMAVARLNRAKKQLADAQTRLGQARERMSAVSAGASMLEPSSLSEQVQAGRDADNAQTDIDTAQKQIDAEREEIRKLRLAAKREQEQLIDQEDNAASAVRAAAARLPDVQLPGGAASPSAYAGTPFGGLTSPFANDPRWAAAMANAAANDDVEEEDDGGGVLGALDDAWDWTAPARHATGNATSGYTNELTFGAVDLGGDKDSGAYKTGQGASYIPVNPASALKSAGTGLLKGGAKVLGKEGAEEAAETGVKKSADDVAGLAPGAAPATGSTRKYWNKSNTVEGKRVHQRDDLIDPARLDDKGRTNVERMRDGVAPIGPDGKSINLHHTTQRNDGALAETTQTFHKDNSKVIHINPNTTPSGIDRPAFDAFRRRYWKERSGDFDPFGAPDIGSGPFP